MKIINKGVAYVQKSDISFLDNKNYSMPSSILKKTFGNKNFIVNERNRYDFVKFCEPEEVEFFENMDCIVDYEEVKNLSKDDICELIQIFTLKRNVIFNEFDSLSFEARQKNSHMYLQCQLLDFEINSFKDILWFKSGYIETNLPEEVNVFNETKNKGLK